MRALFGWPRMSDGRWVCQSWGMWKRGHNACRIFAIGIRSEPPRLGHYKIVVQVVGYSSAWFSLEKTTIYYG